MKILYELVITEETGFTATDFPDRFEILRKGQTPLVFKPVAISTQELYSRLNEAEELLRRVLNGEKPLYSWHSACSQYFERHAQ